MEEQPYTLARWRVRAGQEDTFIAAWRQLAVFFLSLREPPRWGTLLRSIEDPRLFYSFGPWPSMETIAAMRAHPDLIRGPMAADTLLMRELEGWTAKGGAEGLMCAAGPAGLGIALKVEDGSMRAMRPALAELLRRLGIETGELGVEPLVNSRGDPVGEVVAGS